MGIVKPAVDAVQSARAANSIEKMLVHQMTAAHFQAMRLLELAQQERLQAVDRVRLGNGAARLLDVYQTAALTLQKLKSDAFEQGRQRHFECVRDSGGWVSEAVAPLLTRRLAERGLSERAKGGGRHGAPHV